jgi:RNA polymerase sigma-70 factor (ECF subfamily)
MQRVSETPEDLRRELVALLPRLRRFARALTRHVDDADDFVQLAIERALTRLDQRRPGSRLDSWMYGIIRNAWIDETRSRRRRERTLEDDESTEGVPDAASEAHIERLSLEAAMARLPEEQRLAVALVLVEGLAYKEAAEVMGVPIGTVTSRLARGRETLEALLGGRGGGVS